MKTANYILAFAIGVVGYFIAMGIDGAIKNLEDYNNCRRERYEIQREIYRLEDNVTLHRNTSLMYKRLYELSKKNK